jgi:putative flippase GtrA
VTGWRTQGARFAAVGLLSNATLYLVYLGLTAMGLGPKLSMTLLFALGTLQTFVLNRTWTFRHGGRLPQSLVRYLTAYAACYVLNLALLYVLVDRHGLPHAVVQGFAILGIAVLLFLIQKFWVFRAVDRPDAGWVRPA